MNTVEIKCLMKTRTDLNIKQTAHYFYEQMKMYSEKFGQFHWSIDASEKKYDIREEKTIQKIEKKTLLNANIAKYTKFKINDFNDLSISIRFSEGLRENSFSLKFNIGPPSIVTNQNSISIINTGKFKDLNTFSEYREFLDLLVEKYSPSRIEIFHNQIYFKNYLVYSEVMEQLQQKLPNKKEMKLHGWMTYFGKDYPIPDLSDKFDMETLCDGSKILYTTREEFYNEKHIDELIRINNYLIDNQIFAVHIS